MHSRVFTWQDAWYNRRAMKQIKLFYLAPFISLLFLFGAVPTVHAVEFNFSSHIIVNLETGETVSSKNSTDSYPIASITKLMNAVVAKEQINPDSTITLTKEMLKPYGYSPSLFLNLTVRAKNLLQASLIQSTNDAAESLSYFVGKDKFLSLMNSKAKELGMQKTAFYDTHGMDVRNTSTAEDLSKLLAYIHKNYPDILEITKNDDFWMPDPNGRMLKFKNLNVVMASAGFVGGKSGYLPEARNTFASVFTLSGKPYAVVLLNSKTSISDMQSILSGLKSTLAQR